MSHSNSSLAHHFDDLEQQRLSAEFGMWLFLITEVLFFGGVMAGYVVYRTDYEDIFAKASHHNNIVLGTINTAVLLTSSLMMALAVQSAQAGQRKRLINTLIGTLVFGVAFLGIKGFEYWHHYQEGLMPIFDLPFKWDDPGEKGPAKLFFSLYFLMTGIHALHMIIGIVILIVLTVMAYRGKLLSERATPVHLSGLYWHFVDIVWVFLFPFLYLIGARAH